MAHFISWTVEALKKYPSRPLFKEYVDSNDSPEWISVSYETFLDDLERSAAYWVQNLSELEVKQNDVVGLWITGVKYSDLAHIYGLARAGYIPEVLGASLTIPIIRDLFAKTGGKTLLFEPTFANLVTDFELPSLAIPELGALPAVTSPLPPLPDVAPTDPGLIFHTSGTTSGIPKPIPETHRWIKCQAQVLWPKTWQCYPDGRPLILNNIGSFANIGSATSITYLSWSGHCMVKTSKPDFELDEFLAMLPQGLNALFLYAPWFSKLLNIARVNPTVLAALQRMGQINYTGAALNPEDEIWATEQGIPVTALYATTETAITMVTPLAEKGILPAMRLIEGLDYKFIPTKGLDHTDLDRDSEQRVQGGQLFDLFLPAEADNCPHHSIRNRPDGHITGDLFEEVQPGLYCFRGRNDDWIRTGKHFAFCDTKSIEDHVLTSCADLVRNCVVVGHYKPAVVLFVEPVNPSGDDGVLKTAVLERISSFNARLMIHERVTTPVQIVSVPSGSLPRTKEKGNIRRKAVEDEHSDVLKEIYANIEV
ncbi:acetyl-CoA synthetase-like protein [Mycena albidolilacea]|uniref:Acetyl-CoA synthetase-like protein n=1 Tax=Mycena albidolilacea TaxID=1033008 RepID=A0AAD7EK64_9AGAR|nr:acetyl-CoA synthetase-like protein [Mycena albidolilacea]